VKGFLHSLVYLRSDEEVAGIFLAIDGDGVALGGDAVMGENINGDDRGSGVEWDSAAGDA
jgi:hypothetical protein